MDSHNQKQTQEVEFSKLIYGAIEIRDKDNKKPKYELSYEEIKKKVVDKNEYRRIFKRLFS